MVIITNYKSGDFYLKEYHIKHLVSYVLVVMRSKHVNETTKQHHQQSNIFQLCLSYMHYSYYQYQTQLENI